MFWHEMFDFKTYTGLPSDFIYHAIKAAIEACNYLRDGICFMVQGEFIQCIVIILIKK